VGPNGAGKTTLLRMLAGTLAPDTGTRKLGHQVTPYYFAQHSLEMLEAHKTVLEHMQQTLPDSSPTVVRGMLGAFLFGRDMVEAQVGVLSGGEKNRLALALMLATPANLLLLDEPTNHLDLGSRDVLESALTQYAGTLVCISHDRYFLTQVATRIWSVSENAGFEDFEGTFEAYQWHLQQRQAAAREAAVPQKASETPKPSAAGGENYKDRKAQARLVRQKEQKIAAVEALIAAAEARVKEIDRELCDPAVFNDTQRSQALLSERETLQDERLPAHMATWEALSLAD
jgi:ATP-binding cassette subfamily F protein 3